MEFSIVIPVFILMILGIMEFGRGFMVIHLLTDAARKGCRSAAVLGSSTATITSTINDILTSGSIPGSATTITVKVNTVIADASSAKSGDRIQVIVSVPASQVNFVSALSYLTGNLSGQYTMNRE